MAACRQELDQGLAAKHSLPSEPPRGSHGLVISRRHFPHHPSNLPAQQSENERQPCAGITGGLLFPRCFGMVAKVNMSEGPHSAFDSVVAAEQWLDSLSRQDASEPTGSAAALECS